MIREDSISATQWETSEKRAKHVDIRFHFVKKAVSDGEIEIEYCTRQNMLADTMMKGLSSAQFEKLRIEMRVCVQVVA